jgi:hypothetical protein
MAAGGCVPAGQLILVLGVDCEAIHTQFLGTLDGDIRFTQRVIAIYILPSPAQYASRSQRLDDRRHQIGAGLPIDVVSVGPVCDLDQDVRKPRAACCARGGNSAFTPADLPYLQPASAAKGRPG